MNTLAVATLIYGVATGRLGRFRAADAALSTGLNSGLSGIVVAHELIHRRARAWQRRAGHQGDLFLVNYTHFAIEHVQGHHKWVGTRRDPSTARPGESVYVYLARSLPQQFLYALGIEARRLGRLGRWRYGPGNFVVAATLLQVSIAVLIGVGLGPRALSAYLKQGAMAVVLLQVVNYLQHYGLERAPGSKIAPAHSWQTDRISSRFLLLELPRHADHHCHSTRPYHRLLSHEESPTLPLGLLGTAPLLLIPPLWSRIARGILDRGASRRRPYPRPRTARPTRERGAVDLALVRDGIGGVTSRVEEVGPRREGARRPAEPVLEPEEGPLDQQVRRHRRRLGDRCRRDVHRPSAHGGRLVGVEERLLPEIEAIRQDAQRHHRPRVEQAAGRRRGMRDDVVDEPTTITRGLQRRGGRKLRPRRGPIAVIATGRSIEPGRGRPHAQADGRDRSARPAAGR